MSEPAELRPTGYRAAANTARRPMRRRPGQRADAVPVPQHGHGRGRPPDIAAITAALPPSAVTGTRSYLTVKAADTADVAVDLPFLVAFGVISLVLSLLIVVNAVRRAVLTGYARIG